MPSTTFIGKTVAIAAVCAVCSSAAQAISVTVYNSAIFVPAAHGAYQLNGFGRGDTVPAGLSPDIDLQPSLATELFFDVWNVDVSNMAPGNYQFSSTVVFATGSVLFQNVAFNSYDEWGNRNTVLFEVSSDGKQASGSGSFSVVKPCPVQSCVWIDVFGAQDLSVAQTGYGSTIVVAQVPEPASYALLLTGLAGVAALSRRRRR